MSGAAAFGPSYLFHFNGEDIFLFPAGGIHSADDMLKDRILKEFDSWHTLLDWLGTVFWTRAIFAGY